MFQYEIGFIYAVAMVFLGISLFFTLVFLHGLLCKSRPLKKRGRAGKELEKDRKNLVLIVFVIYILVLSVILYLLSKEGISA